MSETAAQTHATISEELMLGRLAQSGQMREFFIQVWKQNPALVKQGGEKVQSLLSQLPLPVGEGGGGGETARAGKLQRGISLIELIMFIVIISVGLTGILLVMNQTTRHGADPIVRKQALAIAESLLEEIELMPSTFCDPDDASAVTATSPIVGAGGCNATVEALGPETIGGTTEARYGGAAVNAQFDNANDYQGFSMTGINDITNTAVAGLTGYSASVAVTNSSIAAIPSSESLLISVTVTPPSGDTVVMEGYRTRYSPRI